MESSVGAQNLNEVLWGEFCVCRESSHAMYCIVTLARNVCTKCLCWRTTLDDLFTGGKPWWNSVSIIAGKSDCITSSTSFALGFYPCDYSYTCKSTVLRDHFMHRITLSDRFLLLRVPHHPFSLLTVHRSLAVLFSTCGTIQSMVESYRVLCTLESSASHPLPRQPGMDDIYNDMYMCA